MVNTNSSTATAIQPVKLKLPPELAELVRLAQAGTNEEALIAFIQKSPPTQPVTSEQIVYLRDLGISSRVLEALVANQPSQSAQTGSDTNASAAQYETNLYAEEVPPADYNPLDAAYFYNSLAPYGTWMDVPSYGWVWQPVVYLVDPSWRPYCHGGRWKWSDYGWYWHSDYSWGWAPFHYGRWWKHAQHGWLWRPNRAWAPAWVAWRQAGDFYGWAPLPPSAVFRVGTGWTFNGKPVAGHHGFGLNPDSFTFVSSAYLLNPNPHRFRVAEGQASQLFRQATLINTLRFGPNRRLFNDPFGPARIQAATGTIIPQELVADMQRIRPQVLIPGSANLIPGSGDPRVSGPPPIQGDPFDPRNDPRRTLSATGRGDVTRLAAKQFAQQNRGPWSPAFRPDFSHKHKHKHPFEPIWSWPSWPTVPNWPTVPDWPTVPSWPSWPSWPTEGSGPPLHFVPKAVPYGGYPAAGAGGRSFLPGGPRLPAAPGTPAAPARPFAPAMPGPAAAPRGGGAAPHR